MIETFIHEEYVNKRREQRRQNQQQRRRRPMRALQIETEKGKPKLPASSAAEGQQSPRDQHQPAAAYKSPAGSPTAADAASFKDHLFDYLKPY